MAGRPARPIRYIGDKRFALGTLGEEGVSGWVEPGEVILIHPRIAARLRREPEWEHASSTDLREQEEE